MILFFNIIILASPSPFEKSDFEKDILILRSLDIKDDFLLDDTSIFMKTKLDKRAKYFLKSLKKGNIFIPILRNIFLKEKIPEVFLYMAMAESNFSLTAESFAKANGLWQFMPKTAKRFGLKINYFVDERRDPIKSTKSAIKYLKYLYNRFGKWYLVAIAYNCGEGRLSKAIKRAGTDDLKVLLNPNKNYIPKESRLYIRRIITLSQLANNYNFLIKHSMEYLLNQGSTKTLKVVYLWGSTSLSDVAKSLNFDLKELMRYNKHIKLYKTPPIKGKYAIYIPYNRYNRVAYNYNESKLDKKFIIHTVSNGDTLKDIAKKYRVDYKKIKDFNDIKDNILSINQKIIIPIDKKEKKAKKDDNLPTLREFVKRYKS